MATLMSKLEWVSPFEMAVQRHWKSYIVELNSTQLNLYYSDPEQAFESLHHSRSHLFLHHSRSSSTVNTSTGMNTGTIVDSGTDISVDKLLLQADMDNQRYDSSMTTKDDIDRLHLFRNENLLTKSNMAKSYSLQYGKVGLAIDYKKKKFTLRLRLETEQFLLQFPCAEAMVEWYSALCLGIDNALDLNRRAMPRYRTVPRRRRHVRRTTERTPLIGRGRHHSIENLFRRRTGSSPEVGGFMSRLKMRFGSSSNIEADSSNNSIREESVTPSEHTEFSLGYSPESELPTATRSSRLHAPGGLSTGYFGVEPGASSDMLELPESQHSDGEDSEQVSTSNTHNDSEDDSENDVDYEAEDGIIDQTDIESDADLISRNDVMNDTDGIFFETSRTRGHTESSLRLPRQQRASSYCSVSATSVNAIGVPIPNIRYNGALCGRIGLSSSLSPCMSSESASASSPLSDMSSPGLVSTTPTTSIDSAGHNVHPIGCVAKEVEEEACSTCAHVPETDGRSSQESQERECTDEEEDRLSSGSSERGGEPYVAFIEKLRSYVDVITIPARRRQIRDSMRCMMPLIGSERWAGRYLVKDAVRDYHPKPDVKDTKVLITKW
ncbi:DEKNAAC100009 [Brettanomyces naardenensis]|uniref:DEKNAAC100009 n=1 Tax=Brettanomyces naardenensis TaxID=13370 RepID=A0A448YEY4_BRENA|nr:DEKNAAC100009 [Brettanomyces naardenensis]